MEWSGVARVPRRPRRCLKGDFFDVVVAHATLRHHRRSFVLPFVLQILRSLFGRAAAASLYSTMYVRRPATDRDRDRPLWLNTAAAVALNLLIWPFVCTIQSIGC